jgi:hypothetical protein
MHQDVALHVRIYFLHTCTSYWTSSFSLQRIKRAVDNVANNLLCRPRQEVDKDTLSPHDSHMQKSVPAMPQASERLWCAGRVCPGCPFCRAHPERRDLLLLHTQFFPASVKDFVDWKDPNEGFSIH